MENENTTLPDYVAAGNKVKATARLALKLLLGASAGMILLVIALSESTADYIVDGIQQSGAKIDAYEQSIAELQEVKAHEEEKLMIFSDALERLKAGEEVDREDLVVAGSSGKAFIESGSRTEFLKNNAAPELRDKSELFEQIGLEYSVDPDLLVCIAFADSGLGNQLKTEHNYGNVGNSDSGATQSFTSITEGIMAIGKVLNNQYLGEIEAVGGLSYGGGGEGYVYATSEYNWNTNVLNCLRDIKDDNSLDESSGFRL